MTDPKQQKQQSPTQVARVDPRLQAIREMIVRSAPQFQMAIPKNLSMSADRLVRVAMTAIQKNPDLLACDIRSLIAAVMECAQLGLVPDGVLGHCYILPFDNSGKKRTEASFLMGYKGYIELAHRSGKIDAVEGRVVRAGDEFDYDYGTKGFLHHKPLAGGPADRPLLFAYAMFRFRSGASQFEVLDAEDILRSKKVSKTASKDWSPWKTNEIAMWRKTAIRIGGKYVPLSPEMQRAVSLDELAEEGYGNADLLGGLDDAIDITPTGGSSGSGPAQKEHTKTAEDLKREAAEALAKAKLAGAETKDGAPDTKGPESETKDHGSDPSGGFLE